MSHPNEVELTLYAGGDLPFWKRCLTALHVRTCEDCRAAAGRYRNGIKFVQESAQVLPEDLDWDELAREMQANVQVGVAHPNPDGLVIRVEEHSPDFKPFTPMPMGFHMKEVEVEGGLIISCRSIRL